MNKDKKLIWQYCTATGMLIFGSFMAASALFIEPRGEIDGTVLNIFAQCLIYAGTIFGVGTYVSARLKEYEDRTKRPKRPELPENPESPE